jgi:hypothetical protein
MKVIVMKKMNVMVLEKLHYLMEIHMKVNIKMEKDMELELIDFPIQHVILVSFIIFDLDYFILFFISKTKR